MRGSKSVLLVLSIFMAAVRSASATTSSPKATGTLNTRSVMLRKKGFPEVRVALAECSLAASRPKATLPKKQGTMVVLHGRGGSGQLLQILETFKSTACTHGLRVVAPEAPTANRNWPFESNRGEGQDTYLLQFLQKDLHELFALKSVQAVQPLLLVGISAGATFLMGDFYPRHGHQLIGKAVALCGGAWPSQSSIEDMKSLESRFPLFVQIGRSDFLFDQVQLGLSRYAELGLPLRAHFTDAPGHCAFDFNQAIDMILKLK